MEAKILNRGLKLIENFYNASMYTDDVWDNDLYRIKDTIDSLDSNHWKSKQWLVDELIKVYKDDGSIEQMKRMTDTVIRRVYNEPKVYKESNKMKK